MRARDWEVKTPERKPLRSACWRKKERGRFLPTSRSSPPAPRTERGNKFKIEECSAQPLGHQSLYTANPEWPSGRI